MLLLFFFKENHIRNRWSDALWYTDIVKMSWLERWNGFHIMPQPHANESIKLNGTFFCHICHLHCAISFILLSYPFAHRNDWVCLSLGMCYTSSFLSPSSPFIFFYSSCLFRWYTDGNNFLLSFFPHQKFYRFVFVFCLFNYSLSAFCFWLSVLPLLYWIYSGKQICVCFFLIQKMTMMSARRWWWDGG